MLWNIKINYYFSSTDVCGRLNLAVFFLQHVRSLDGAADIIMSQGNANVLDYDLMNQIAVFLNQQKKSNNNSRQQHTQKMIRELETKVAVAPPHRPRLIWLIMFWNLKKLFNNN